MTRNHHWGSRWFTDRNRALWSSFVVRLPAGGNVFFAGDTDQQRALAGGGGGAGTDPPRVDPDRRFRLAPRKQ
ncbi:hypothetical protein AB5I41_03420 [Sphingomonas sp. MMS24-JH45]